MDIHEQLFKLFIISIPIACISWTVTHEEVFREPREFFLRKSKSANALLERKFFYLFTCEYCFSHYVAIAFLAFTRFKLIYESEIGYIISGFALVWIANIYMSLYAFLRIDIKKERIKTNLVEKKEKAEEVLEDVD